MRFRALGIGLAVLALCGRAHDAQAGMPSLGPSEFAQLRIEAISFFLGCFLVAAKVIQWIWNGLRADLPRLPRLSYGKAVGVVILWGLLFLLVLTMISGARELMTPGAWRKEGLVYKLRDPKAETQPPGPAGENLGARRGRLEQLRLSLWEFARNHDGNFPTGTEVSEIPAELWTLPDPSGMRYLYVSGLRRDQGEIPLVYEPGIFGTERLVLLASGAIRWMLVEEIRRLLPIERR